MALVSVIVPVYNTEKYLSRCLDSIAHQTLQDIEIICVDDGSTDDTACICKKYVSEAGDMFRYVYQENKGLGAARNKGLSLVETPYTAFLDSDDLWMPDKLEKQIMFMEEKKIGFSCTAYRQMDEKGNNLSTIMIPPKKISYQKCIYLSNPIGNLTVMYNQEVLGKFKVPEIKKRNDFALWLQILKKTKYCYGMKEVLGIYRKGRSGSVSSNKLSQAKYHWKLYHEIEKHGIVKSGFEVGCWAFVKGVGFGRKQSKDTVAWSMKKR